MQSDIQRAKSGRDLNAATRGFYSAADVNAGGAANASGLKFDCRDGCALCCVFRVMVRAHEVFVIAEHINESFSAADREALLQRLQAHQARVKSMSADEHKATNVPCPLLVNSRCSVYRVRPFGCRSHHSYDVSVCQYSHDNPRDLEFPGARHPEYLALWMTMSAHAHGAFESAGFDDAEYELGGALLAALLNPASVKRWRDRKKPLLS